MSDKFKTYTPELDGPAEYAFAVTPNDSANLANFCRAVYIGTAGNLAVTTVSGSTVTFVGLLAGSIYPIRCKKIFSTGTTASNIIGLY